MKKFLGILLVLLSPAAFGFDVDPAFDIPEPGTMALFGAAAIGAGLAGRLAKRSKKQ
jgi:hypothetical protein